MVDLDNFHIAFLRPEGQELIFFYYWSENDCFFFFFLHPLQLFDVEVCAKS